MIPDRLGGICADVTTRTFSARILAARNVAAIKAKILASCYCVITSPTRRMLMNRTRLHFLAISTFLAVGCGSELPHDGPFDPLAPFEQQAKAKLSLTVALEGESDASQVTLQLQNEERTYTAESDAAGAIVLTGVVPGTYDLRLTARSFETSSEKISVPLGEDLDLGSFHLPLKRVVVVGTAEVDRGGAPGTKGGVLLSLLRKSGVQKAAWPSFAPLAGEQGFTYSALSGSDGSFRISDVPAGSYDVEAVGPDGQSQPMGELVITGDEPEVAAEPVLFKVVSGFFEIEGISNGIPSSVFSQTNTVRLKLYGFNAVAMQIGETLTGNASGCTFSAASMPFVSPLNNYELPREGNNHVCVRYIGEDGSVTAPSVETIYVDSIEPLNAGIVLNNGLLTTTSPLVTAGFSVIGADEMYVSQAGCLVGGSWQGFTPFLNLNLGSEDGEKTVYVVFRDYAGNQSDCVQASVWLDSELYAPMWGGSFAGDGVVGSRTRNQLVTILLTGITSDVAEMRVANDSGFAGSAWSPIQNSLSWLLPPGDGLKSVYVKLRDAAGNESETRTLTITLDQTGPMVPGLAVQDIDEDGYALSASTVELKWSRPSAGDLAGFELQRFVQGVTPTFETLASPASDTVTWVDDVAATKGAPHYYQIRAFDDLGNVSAWSVAASAIPFQGIDQLYWANGENGTRYFFPAQPGTNSLTPVYFYSDVAGAEYSSALANNITSWLRPGTSSDYWNENLLLRTANQDNSLIYESEFPLRLSRMETVDKSNDGAYLGYGVGIATDNAGNAWVSYFDGANGYLVISDNKDGAWKREIADPDYVVTNSSQIMRAPDGAIHLIYLTGYGKLRYAHNQSGAWQYADMVTGNLRNLSARMDKDGGIHVIYNITTTCCATSDIRYASLVNGAWADELIQTVGYSQETPVIAVDADKTVHVAYHEGTAHDLIYAVKPVAGTFAFTTLDSTGTVGLSPAMTVAPDGNVHITYRDSSYNQKHVYQASGWQGPDIVATGARKKSGIEVAHNGEVFIFYEGASYTLTLLRGTPGAWRDPVVLDNDIDTGWGNSFRVTRDRRGIHFVYMEVYEKKVKYGAIYPGGELVDSISAYAGSMQTPDFAVGPDGTVHIVYRVAWWNDIYYVTQQSGKWTNTLLEAEASNSRIRVDASGKLHFLYAKDGLVKYRTAEDGVWSATEDAVAAGSAPAFELNPAGEPGFVHLAGSYSNYTVTYVHREGGTWSSEPVTGVPYTTPSLAYSPEGTAVAAVSVAAEWASTLELYERVAAGSWQKVASFSPPITTAGGMTALAYDKDGALHVAFQDYVEVDQWYGTNRGGSWSFTRVDTEGDAGYYPKIFVDSRGVVHLTYAGGSNRFMYATTAGGWNRMVIKSLGYDGAVGGAAMDASETLHTWHSFAGNAVYRPFTAGRQAPARNDRIRPW